MEKASTNPFAHLEKTLTVNGKQYKYFSLKDLNDPRVGKLKREKFFWL
jgi:hypothetical protein